jgi:hypothetical protein
MINKTLLLVPIISFILVSPVLAESPTPSTSTNNNFRLEVKEARENRIEAREQAREEYQTRLQQIKDERKRQIVENVSNRIAVINQNRTSIMLKHLDQIESVLTRLETKITTAKTNGKDVGSVESDIASAKTAISTARTKVSTQSTKTYTINITTESTLASAVATTRQAFQADLKSAHDSVVAARTAVSLAIQNLAKVLGETIINNN